MTNGDKIRQRNMMEQVAAMFGKKLGDEILMYYCTNDPDRGRFMDSGFYVMEGGHFVLSDTGLRHLLTGAVRWE